MGKRIIISATSDIVNDQRVLKTAFYLHKRGYKLILVGRKLSGSPDPNEFPFRIVRFRMIFRQGFLFYKFYSIRLFFFLLFHSADILWSNDLDTLLPNWLVSKLRNKQLIYDAHEYFTGVPELANKNFAYRVWKFLERKIVPKIDRMVTVNASIADLYKKEYGVNPVIIRNLSVKVEIEPYQRSRINVSEEDILLVLQGTGINRGRGGSELIKALRMANGIHLLVIGTGTDLDNMQKLADSLNINSKVTFLPPMPWEDMIRYTAMCDVGLSLDSGEHMNYLYSLPNKVFDYMMAGLAIIATDLPEVSGVIKEFDCGLLLQERTEESITEAVKKLKNDKALLKRLKFNAAKGSENLDWEKEITGLDNFL